MAIQWLKVKESCFKFQNISSCDYFKNNVQIEVDKNNLRLKEFKLAIKEKDYVSSRFKKNSDSDSICKECYRSDTSDSESEFNNNLQPFGIIAPLFAFTNSKDFDKIKKYSIKLNKQSISIKKMNVISSLTLHDRMRCLSLNKIHQSKEIQVKPVNINMSFTNGETLQIEQDNRILLRPVIDRQRNQKLKLKPIQPKLSSSAINRKKLQKKIEKDNMLLLRRLQQAKSCIYRTTKLPGNRAM